MSFSAIFIKKYDKAISSGVCSFTQTGINKNDFTRLCVESDFVLDDESIIRAARAMKLDEEELEELLRIAAEER